MASFAPFLDGAGVPPLKIRRPRRLFAITLFLLGAGCGGGGDGGGGSGAIEETAQMAQSLSSAWWLNSGAIFEGNDSGGSTVHGDLSDDSPWRSRYAASNPGDTDGGRHPQNVFRLIRRQIFANPHQEMTFEVRGIQASPSRNRNDTNGVLLLSHYLDGDNLYYAGVRVDGAAVIKKKRRGGYVTLAYARVYPGSYDRNRRPNLIPTSQPIHLASDTLTNADGSVTVRLFVDGTLVLEAIDRGRSGGPALREAGYVGIRTDFMDAVFHGYAANEIR